MVTNFCILLRCCVSGHFFKWELHKCSCVVGEKHLIRSRSFLLIDLNWQRGCRYTFPWMCGCVLFVCIRDNRDGREKPGSLFHPHKSLPAPHFKQSAVHYEVWNGHDWLILSPSTLQGLLPKNVSSSPTINLIRLNKSIHYWGSSIDSRSRVFTDE